MRQVGALAVLLLFSSSGHSQQVADTSFSYPISKPAYPKGKGSIITLDEAHFNFHALSGRYYAFGNFLETDGYQLRSGTEKFSPASLKKTKILVIANALPDSGDWVLPTRAAFTAGEVNAVVQWVRHGGNLLLIADHMPFPGAAENLAGGFGFNFINGFAFNEGRKPEIFSRAQGNLLINRITKGRTAGERIDSIMTFTGQGFIPPKEAGIISTLDSTYRIYLPSKAWVFTDSTASMNSKGLCNGAFLQFGKGRVVVFGEAAMFSAQLAGPNKNKMGMNNPRARQNPQLLLNVIHWLDRRY